MAHLDQAYSSAQKYTAPLAASSPHRPKSDRLELSLSSPSLMLALTALLQEQAEAPAPDFIRVCDGHWANPKFDGRPWLIEEPEPHRMSPAEKVTLSLRLRTCYGSFSTASDLSVRKWKAKRRGNSPNDQNVKIAAKEFKSWRRISFTGRQGCSPELADWMRLNADPTAEGIVVFMGAASAYLKRMQKIIDSGPSSLPCSIERPVTWCWEERLAERKKEQTELERKYPRPTSLVTLCDEYRPHPTGAGPFAERYQALLKDAVHIDYMSECKAAQERRDGMYAEARAQSDRFANSILDPEIRDARIRELRRWRHKQACYWAVACVEKDFRRSTQPPPAPDGADWEYQLLCSNRGRLSGGDTDLLPTPKTAWLNFDAFLRCVWTPPPSFDASFHQEVLRRDTDPREEETRTVEVLQSFGNFAFDAGTWQGDSDDANEESRTRLNEFSDANGFRQQQGYVRVISGEEMQKTEQKVRLFRHRMRQGDYASSIDPNESFVHTFLEGQEVRFSLQNEEFKKDAISLVMTLEDIPERDVAEFYGEKESRFMSDRDHKMLKRFEQDQFETTDSLGEFLEASAKKFSGDHPLSAICGIFVLVHWDNQCQPSLFKLDLDKFGGNNADPFAPANYEISDRSVYKIEIEGDEVEFQGSPVVAAFEAAAQQKAEKLATLARRRTPNGGSDPNPATAAFKAGRAARFRCLDQFRSGTIFKIRPPRNGTGPRLEVSRSVKPAFSYGLLEGLLEGSNAKFKSFQ